MSLAKAARLSLAALAICVFAPGASHAQSVVEFAARTYDKTLSDNWSNILFGGAKIGFSHQKIEQGPKGYRITSHSIVKMQVMDDNQEVSFSHTFYLDADKKPRGFVSLKTIQNQRMQTTGEVRGGKLLVETSGAGGGKKFTQAIPEGAKFLETLDLSLKDYLKPGLKTTIPVFVTDFRTMDQISLEVKDKKQIVVEGKTVEAYLVEVRVQGLTERSYVTPEGENVREENDLGFVTEKTTEAEALKFPSTAVSVNSLISLSLIKPDKPLPDHEKIKEIHLIVGGMDTPVTIPSDDRQTASSPYWKKAEGGKSKLYIPIVIKKQSPPAAYNISRASREKSSYVQATPEIQSDNKMIAREAKSIVGAEKDVYKAAVLINRWVNKNVKKKLVDSISAIDVYFSREGECQSHTNLFAALARSVGIPVRIAGGIVYTRDAEGFLYHVWPEVYAGKWIALDPTLGQDMADVTHIKLLENADENPLTIFQFLVKISVSVESSVN